MERQTKPRIMSKIIYCPSADNGDWCVYLTPHGADPESGDEDEFVEDCADLSAACRVLLDAIAEQDRDAIERNREEIAAYERKIEEQKAELLVSDCDWEKVEAKCRALFRRQLAIIHGEISEQLEETGISFEALAQFHSATESR